MDRKKHLELELAHILIEIQAGRGQHLRHFVDQYFCYSNGYIKSSGAPHWDRILWHEYVSVSANKLSRDNGYTHVTRDHVVPLKQLRSEMLGLLEKNTLAIASLLDSKLHFATITKDENALLNSMGLRQKMPAEYFEEGHTLHGSIFARYEKAGIALLPRQKPTPFDG